MAHLSRACLSPHYYSIVTMYVSGIFNVKEWRDLETGIRSFKITENGTMRKLECIFVFVFHGNYDFILCYFQDKTRQAEKSRFS